MRSRYSKIVFFIRFLLFLTATILSLLCLMYKYGSSDTEISFYTCINDKSICTAAEAISLTSIIISLFVIVVFVFYMLWRVRSTSAINELFEYFNFYVFVLMLISFILKMISLVLIKIELVNKDIQEYGTSYKLAIASVVLYGFSILSVLV